MPYIGIVRTEGNKTMPTVMELNAALAKRFTDYAAACALAKTLAADDPDWTYAVNTLTPGVYVVGVSDEANEFLGYL
jgi:protein involved in polysaccharide export with SLBB domain